MSEKRRRGFEDCGNDGDSPSKISKALLTSSSTFRFELGSVCERFGVTLPTAIHFPETEMVEEDHLVEVRVRFSFEVNVVEVGGVEEEEIAARRSRVENGGQKRV